MNKQKYIAPLGYFIFLNFIVSGCSHDFPAPISNPTETPPILLSPTTTFLTPDFPVGEDEADTESLPPPTQTPLPPTQTSSPTEIPSSTPIPNTQPGTVLEVGQSWRKDGLLLRLDEIRWALSSTCSIGFGFIVENRTSNPVIFSAYTSDFEFVDNRNERWDITGVETASKCPRWGMETVDQDIVEPGKSEDFFVGIYGPVADSAVDYIIVTVLGLLDFNGAQWKIPISN